MYLFQDVPVLGTFQQKLQLCFGLSSPESGYVSILLALNCLMPVSSTCTSLFCSSSRLDSGKTELPCVQIKALTVGWCSTELEMEGEVELY